MARLRFFMKTSGRPTRGKAFQDGAATFTEDPQTHNNYGQYLCRHGEYTQALEQFKIAASDPLYPGVAASLTNAGICAGSIPDAKQAEDYFRKALEHDQNYAYALLQMADLMFTQGDNMAARAYIQRFDGVSNRARRACGSACASRTHSAT